MNRKATLADIAMLNGLVLDGKIDGYKIETDTNGDDYCVLEPKPAIEHIVINLTVDAKQ